jgi:hypothetical protein
MFLRNVGGLVPKYMTLQPGSSYTSDPCIYVNVLRKMVGGGRNASQIFFISSLNDFTRQDKTFEEAYPRYMNNGNSEHHITDIHLRSQPNAIQ